MNDQTLPVTEDMVFQRVAERMMQPECTNLRRSEERALLAMISPDFLTPDWSGLSPIKTMALCEVVALACGMNRRYAWTIEHRVGDGAARAAVDAARDLLGYLVVKHGLMSKSTVALDSMVDWARNVGHKLPVGFPGAIVAPQHVAKSASNEWDFVPSKKPQGYSLHLYAFLREALRDGKPRPTADDVLDHWMQYPPIDISKVTVDAFDCPDAQGRSRTVSRAALHRKMLRVITPTRSP